MTAAATRPKPKAGKPAAPKKMGRPSLYTPELAAEICKRVAAGRSLRSVSKDKDMPQRSAVKNWLNDKPEFVALYRRAREDMAEAWAEDTIEIADDATNDWMQRRSEAEKGKGVNLGWVLNGEHVQRSRLRIDTRKWIVSKLLPRTYGDRTEIEHSGAIATDPATEARRAAVMAALVTMIEDRARAGLPPLLGTMLDITPKKET